MTEHFRSLVQRAEDANMVTVFLAIYQMGGHLNDETVTQTYDEYLRLHERATASTPAEGGAGTSLQLSTAPSSDELWMIAVGGLQRGTYYGMGSYDAFMSTQSSRAPSVTAHSSQPSQALTQAQKSVDC